MVSTHLKNISQIGSFPQVGMKMKNNWNHHPEKHYIPQNVGTHPKLPPFCAMLFSHNFEGKKKATLCLDCTSCCRRSSVAVQRCSGRRLKKIGIGSVKGWEWLYDVWVGLRFHIHSRLDGGWTTKNTSQIGSFPQGSWWKWKIFKTTT